METQNDRDKETLRTTFRLGHTENNKDRETLRTTETRRH